jgi:tripartite-type tricarboxylate transporter receptor subunit TctC
MKLSCRKFLHMAAGAAALPAMPRLAWAQTYPTRPVRIIVTFAAGSANDVNGRLIAQWLSERLGQPFIVESRPGAGGNIGAAEAIRSPADGHTLFLISISHAINESFYSNLPYRIVRDTSPVASLFRARFDSPDKERPTARLGGLLCDALTGFARRPIHRRIRAGLRV